MKKRAGRKSKGRLYQRGEYWYIEYFHNKKRYNHVIKNEKGESVTKEAEAERLRENIINPLRLQDESERKRLLFNSYRDTDEKLEEEQERQREIDEIKHQEELLKQRITINDSWKRYFESTKRPDSGEGTLKQYSFQWKAFTDWLSENYPDIKYLSEVTPKIGNEYSKDIHPQKIQSKHKKLSRNTYNKHIRLCRLVFRVLGKEEEEELGDSIKPNPFDEIKSLKEKQAIRKEIPWDILCKICDAAEGELKTLLFLGIYTGQRLKDCCLLTWDKVDLMRRIIIMTQFKTESSDSIPLHIPIHDQLAPMLEVIPKKQRQGYVLPELAETYLVRNDKITDMIQDLFKNCGLKLHKPGTGPDPKAKNKKVKVRAVLQYGFHSLRHTTASLLQGAGVPQAVAQSILGHKSVAMLNRYTHIGSQALNDAVKKLPGVNGEKSKTAEEKIKEVLKILKAKKQKSKSDKEILEILKA